MNDAEAGTFIAREQRRFERGLCLLLDQGSFPMKAFPAFPVVRVMSLRSLRTCLIARDRDVRRVDLFRDRARFTRLPPQTTLHLDFFDTSIQRRAFASFLALLQCLRVSTAARLHTGAIVAYA